MSSRSLMHRVFPPSKPPDGGYPPSFRLVVGGTQLRGSWYLSAIVRLQGFSSCSPVAPLRRRSPKMVTSSLMAGEKRTGLRPLPLPQPQGFSSPGLRRGVCRVRVGPCVGGGPLLPSVIGGRAVVVRGAGSYSVPGSRTRVASEPLSAPASATAAGRGSSADEIARAAHGPTSNSTAFCPSLPHEFGHGRGPPGSDIRPEVIAATVRPPEQKSSSSLLSERATARRSSIFRCSAGPPPVEWGCSCLRRWNRSSVCNGTSNASVFVHCGCRGLNMYVISARSRVFSSFSSAKTRLLVVRTASPSVSRPV
jgi:hypothetical protein